MIRILSLIFTAVILSSCASLSVTRQETQVVPELQELPRSSFVWGFVPAPRLYESSLCPQSKLNTFEIGRSSGQVWLSVVTLGVYVPYRVRFSCAKS